MFNRDDDKTDPRKPERRLEKYLNPERDDSVAGSSMLLKEKTYLNENERYINRVDGLAHEMGLLRESVQRTETTEIDEGVIDSLVGSMTKSHFFVEVVNFRDGILAPIREFFEERRRSDYEDVSKRHKQSIIYLAQIRDTVERSGSKSGKTITDSFREVIFNLTRSFESAVTTITSPIYRGLGRLLFGAKKREKSPTKAIEEQTLFLRTGKIIDNSTLLGRFFRRGLIPSMFAGGAAMLGVGRSTAQRAEEKLSRGEELTGREQFMRSLIKWGLFTNITKHDLTGKGGRESESREYLKNIHSTAKEILDVAKQSLLVTLAFNGDFGRYFSQGSAHASSVMEDIRNRIVESMRPIMSPFESTLLTLTKDQYYEIKRHREAKELELERDKLKKSGGDKAGGGDGGGLFGFLLPAFKKIGTWGNVYLLAPLMKAFSSARAFLLRGGIVRSIISPLLTSIRVGAPRLIAGFVARFNPFGMLVSAAIAGFQIGKLIEPFVRKAFDFLLKPLGLDFVDVVGGTIYHIVEFVKGAGRWIGNLISGIGSAIGSLGSLIVNSVVGIGKTIGETVGWLGSQIVSIIWGGVKWVWKWITKPLFGVIGDIGKGILKALWSTVKFIGKPIGSAIWWVGKQLMKGAWSVFKWAGSQLFDGIGWVGGKLIDGMFAALKWIGRKISDGVGSLVSWIGKKLEEKLGDVPIIGRFFKWRRDKKMEKLAEKVLSPSVLDARREDTMTERNRGDDDRTATVDRVSLEMGEKLRKTEEEIVNTREQQLAQNGQIINLLSNIVGNTDATVGALFESQAAQINANRKDALLDGGVGEF